MKALLPLLLLAGCASTPEITLLAGKRRIESERDFAVTILVLQKFGKEGHGVAGCVHQSEPANGWPHDDEPEETSDQCGLGMRFGGK